MLWDIWISSSPKEKEWKWVLSWMTEKLFLRMYTPW